MSEVPLQLVSDPLYWRERLGRAIQMEELHRAVYETTRDDWDRIENYQRQVLSDHIRQNTSVIDVGCSWGRLLSLMPKHWEGEYVGIDISPDFMRLAAITYPSRVFMLGDMLKCHELFMPQHFDLAILCSIKGTITRHRGIEEWKQIEASVRCVCKKMLFIDYDGTSEVISCV